MAGEVIGPIGEEATAVVLISGHVLKLPSQYVCSHRSMVLSTLVKEASLCHGQQFMPRLITS